MCVYLDNWTTENAEQAVRALAEAANTYDLIADHYSVDPKGRPIDDLRKRADQVRELVRQLTGSNGSTQ